MQSTFNPHQLEAAMAGLLSSRQFPKLWYQSDLKNYVFAILTTLLGYISVFVFRLHPPFTLSVVAVLVLILSEATDIITTHRVFSLKKQYHDRGLEFTGREKNPLLPDIPSLREIVWGKPTLLFSLVVLLAFFIPLAGIGMAASKLAVSLNNHRNRQQTLYELNLYDTMTRKDLGKERDTR